MKTIQLSQGLETIVDDDDYEILRSVQWSASKCHNGFCAIRMIGGRTARHIVQMHRVIMGATKGTFVDHINGNTLDNRKCNLRLVTNRENLQNRHQEETSKFPGVCWNKNAGKWQSQIRVGEKRHYLGLFDIEEEAHTAYRVAEKVLVNG